MSEFSIRQARAHELALIGELTVSAYRDGGLLGGVGEYSRELADAERRWRQAELLVAEGADGQLLGSVTIARPGEPYAEIARDGELEFRMLATSPAARGRGVGEALTRAVLDRARELGLAKVVLCLKEGNAAAVRLYQRIGFERLPDRDWAPLPTINLIAYSLDIA